MCRVCALCGISYTKEIAQYSTDADADEYLSIRQGMPPIKTLPLPDEIGEKTPDGGHGVLRRGEGPDWREPLQGPTRVTNRSIKHMAVGKACFGEGGSAVLTTDAGQCHEHSFRS